jgi:hypothetical protein
MGGMANIFRFIRAHGRQSIIAALVVVTLAVSGVAYAVSNSGGSSTSPAAAPPTSAPTTTAPASPAAPAKRHPVLRGLLTAIGPGNWTVRTRTGQTIAVIVNPQTQFGTRKAPLASSAFAIGDRIVVSGPQTAITVVAARIAKVPVKAPGSPTSPTSTTVAGTAPAG